MALGLPEFRTFSAPFQDIYHRIAQFRIQQSQQPKGAHIMASAYTSEASSAVSLQNRLAGLAAWVGALRASRKARREFRLRLKVLQGLESRFLRDAGIEAHTLPPKMQDIFTFMPDAIVALNLFGHARDREQLRAEDEALQWGTSG
jgi:hypothetical protein